MVPPAVAEEDEVEEIEREEPRPQAIRILRKHSDDIVIVEEQDTTREFRRLETALAGVTKQIKVSTTFGKILVTLVIGYQHCHSAFTRDNSDCRAALPADKEHGTPR